jgi:hypothetical protein
MKVFLGWSGSTSQQVAFTLRDWFRKVIQSLDPYVSTEDVAKGAPWAESITTELQASKFGVICVTRENLDSKWIHFEAGVLSKQVTQARVSPFLFDLKPSDIEGPLTLFQATLNTKDDIFRLLSVMNKMNTREDGLPHLTEGELQEAFDTRWPALVDAFAKIREAEGSKPAPEKPDPTRMLEELLETTRALQRQTSQRADDFHALRELIEARYGTSALRIAGGGTPIVVPTGTLRWAIPDSGLTGPTGPNDSGQLAYLGSLKPGPGTFVVGGEWPPTQGTSPPIQGTSPPIQGTSPVSPAPAVGKK